MTGPQTLSDFLHQDLLPRLDAEAVYGATGLARSGGRFWRGMCPFHPDSSRLFPLVVDRHTLRWSCLEGCRKGGQSFLAFLNGGHFPDAGKAELRSVLERAAQLAGLPEARVPDFSPENELPAIQQERVTSLLETFFLQAHSALHGEAAAPGEGDAASARSWLVAQGFDPSSLRDLAVGLFTSRDAFRQGLLDAGFTADEIRASALLDDPRLAGRLVGPIRDRWGRVHSFWARHPQDQPPGFLFKGKWKDEVGLFGLEVALHPAAGGLADLIVVERLLDAILLQSMGLRNVAAVGGPLTQLGKRRWQRLSGLGVRRIILVPGPSKDADRAVLASLAILFHLRHATESYVVPPASLRGYASLGDVARTEGLVAASALLADRLLHAYAYEAMSILDRHKTTEGWTDAGQHAAWKEAIEFYAAQGRHAIADLDRHFVPAMVAGLERTWHTFQPLAESQRGLGPFGQPARHSAAAGPGHPVSPTPKHPAQTCPVHRCDPSVCFCFD
jgi:hypothetical protein